MSLTHDMGNVIGRELRAYYNAKVHNSLDTWSPTININRDPRWGGWPVFIYDTAHPRAM
jgi:beta-glucosidase-like glycosyl hydrolase